MSIGSLIYDEDGSTWKKLWKRFLPFFKYFGGFKLFLKLV